MAKKSAAVPLTLASLRKAANQREATVDHRHIGRWHTCNVDAPDGKRWSCSSIHSLVVEWQDDADWRDTAIADALDRMAYGLEECDDEECDHCHPLEDAK